MNISDADRLEIGDRVIAIKGGYSGSVEYHPGDTGTVVEKEGGFFRVCLLKGGETRFVDPVKWERLKKTTVAETTVAETSGNPNPETRKYLERKGFSFSDNPPVDTVDVSRLSGAAYWKAVFGE